MKGVVSGHVNGQFFDGLDDVVDIGLLLLYRDQVFVGQRDIEEDFFKEIVVQVELLVRLLPQLKVFIEFEEDCVELTALLVHLRQKIEANAFVFVLQALQDQQAGNIYENVCIAALDGLFEFGVLVRGCLDYVRKMNQVDLLLRVQQVTLALFPRLLVLHHDFHQVLVVFELGVHDLDVLVILLEKQAEFLEALADLLSQVPDSSGLLFCNPAQNALCL